MSLSGHKAYGPKGVGALLVAQRRVGSRSAQVQLAPLLFGGGQERGLRAGTLATHQVVGMGLAFELASSISSTETVRIAQLQRRLWGGLAALGGGVGARQPSSPPPPPPLSPFLGGPTHTPPLPLHPPPPPAP